ncbi:MAG: phosphoadenylyl-sulfate reductase, partial [candidate division Zixibacteria bacterium]|nr:phosphoadenylyl-sulfate reductase [candidate division Zixibacteria bacterium]
CCHHRKVLPMQDALRPYDAWITGIRRGQTATRSAAQIISFDLEYNVVKICPLLNVSDAEIAAYLAQYELPRNPLLDQGYSSIGCWPCTTRTLPGEDPRAGRWRQHAKTECGLHQPVQNAESDGKDPS